MRERTNAEIDAALTAYHGADGWDENDRADMRDAFAAADAVAPIAGHIEALEAALREIVEIGRYFGVTPMRRCVEIALTALATLDAVAPPIPVVQREQPIPYNELVMELKQLHLSLMSSPDARYRGDAFARAAICIERLLTTAES